MEDVEQSRDYISLGHAAQHLQRSVPDIQVAVGRLGFKPAMTLNGIAYYDWSQVDAIGAMFGAPGPTIHEPTHRKVR